MDLSLSTLLKATLLIDMLVEIQLWFLQHLNQVIV